MSKILVKSGYGFVGSNLVRMLADEGCSVTIFDNYRTGSPDFLDDKERYKLIEGDICDTSAINSAVLGMDAVIHLAASGSVVDSVDSPENNFQTNVRGTFCVLDACRLAGVSKVIFSSTGGALIGNAVPPVSEQSVPRPISPYGASKLSGEGYCCAFSHAYGMSITALRFANVVGPISWHKKGAVTAFCKAIMDNKPITIYGDGTSTRDYLFVGDLCRGITAALHSSALGFHVYHLASGQETSILALAKIIRNVAGVPDHPIVFAEKRAGEVERNFANFTLASAELGFKPQVSLVDAVERTWIWLQQYAKLK